MNAKNLITAALEELKFMEASDTDVFFRFSVVGGKSDKTGIMSPASAKSFLETCNYLEVNFSFLQMLRAEYF